MNYDGIPDTPEGRETCARLHALRKALRKDLPPNKRDSNLIIATWNIREFGNRPRSEEALYYIAEIINRFDLVAIQEVRGDLGDFSRVLDILGPMYSYLVTDITEGRSGNDERMGFIYNKRKVEFGGLTGQVILPPNLNGATPFARTPFQVGFRASKFEFQLCTAHAYYGTDKPDDPKRRAEIRNLGQYLLRRARDSSGSRAWARHYFVLGDFNIFQTTDETRKELEDAEFQYPEKLKELISGFAKEDKHYDQLAYLTDQPMFAGRFKKADMGAFDFFSVVYTNDDEERYTKELKGKEKYGQWRTFQMSDHRPLWFEFSTESADAYLSMRASGAPPLEHGKRKPTPAATAANTVKKTTKKKASSKGRGG